MQNVRRIRLRADGRMLLFVVRFRHSVIAGDAPMATAVVLWLGWCFGDGFGNQRQYRNDFCATQNQKLRFNFRQLLMFASVLDALVREKLRLDLILVPWRHGRIVYALLECVAWFWKYKRYWAWTWQIAQIWWYCVAIATSSQIWLFLYKGGHGNWNSDYSLQIQICYKSSNFDNIDVSILRLHISSQKYSFRGCMFQTVMYTFG